MQVVVSTVEVHRSNITRKLDLYSVAEPIQYAIRDAFYWAHSRRRPPATFDYLISGIQNYPVMGISLLPKDG